MKYLLIFTTFLFAGELEVDGDLTVLGNVNAPGLGGMKPERIYRYIGNNYETKELIVSEGKVWIISSSITNSAEIQILDESNDIIGFLVNDNGGNNNIVMLSGDNFSIHFQNGAIINIYEYSISGSGTDQGMDYVEP